MMDREQIFAAWENMPEFVQPKQVPYAKIRVYFLQHDDDLDPFSTIIVRFDNKTNLDEFADFLGIALTPETTDIIRVEPSGNLDEFAKLIGQPLTMRTKSIWHPRLVRGLTARMRYIDAS